jgi:hypothetical protein
MGIGQWLKTNVFKRNFGIDAVQEAPVHASVDLDQVAGRWRAAGARLVERFEKIVVVHLSANSRLVIDNERASFDGAIDHEAMIAGLKHVQGELDGIFKPEGPDLFKVEAWAYAKVYAEVYGVKIDYTPPHRLLRDAAAMLTKVEALREQERCRSSGPGHCGDGICRDGARVYLHDVYHAGMAVQGDVQSSRDVLRACICTHRRGNGAACSGGEAG